MSSAPTGPSIEIQLNPDSVTAPLLPRPAGLPLERLRPLWHQTPALPWARLTLTSQSERSMLLRMSVACDDPRWRAGWVQWSFAVRSVPEIHGGDAVAAQDVLLEDATILQMLLLPGETRDALLQVRAQLDGETPTGDFVFDVCVSEVGSDASVAVTGMLRLRHPPGELEAHLPSIYTEEMDHLQARATDPLEAPFFRRYLRGFDDAAVPMREMLDNLHRFLDANETPPDFLPWLATWVDLVLDENWPEMKRRKLIREAVQLYRWRGTRRGLARYLEIYAGVRPEINDRPFRGMRLGPKALLGTDLSDPTKLENNTVLGDVPDHSFVVTVAVPDPAAVNEQTVRDIIEAQKPAHTAYVARIVRRAPSEE